MYKKVLECTTKRVEGIDKHDINIYWKKTFIWFEKASGQGKHNMETLSLHQSEHFPNMPILSHSLFVSSSFKISEGHIGENSHISLRQI